jgi:hypothetical protein
MIGGEMTFPKASVVTKNGTEALHENGNATTFSLIDFWRWSFSDLLSNATRGVVAEFIVATALQIPLTVVRNEWSAWDLTTPDGIKIEVKSAAFIQSWHQDNLSKISFSVKKSKAWDADLNKHDKIEKRQADVYVFALLAHQDKATIDPLNLSQWKFYVLPTEVLNQPERSQHSITLPSLVKLCQGLPYSSIGSAVLNAANSRK